MKNLVQYTKYLCGGLLLLATVACSDYFDVLPKSQVAAEKLFEKESGYNDQLIGVYTRLATTSLYGQEMTFGLVESLGQNYEMNTGNIYYEASQYNYENTATKDRISTIWSEMYSAIANLNIMLEYLNDDDENSGKFSDDNYNLYKGEALGLRAFLHFDLLRLFAPSYLSGSGSYAIPYVTEYTTSVTPQGTVSEVLDNIIADAEEALELLEVDPMYTVIADSAFSYRGDRAYHFNYYAVAATLARAYLWKGDLSQALYYAEKVIDDDKFSWVHYTAVITSYAYERDVLFSPEIIFRLNVNDLSDLIDEHFTSSASSSNKLSPSQEMWYDIYEVNTKAYGGDWRQYYHWSYSGSDPYLSKFWQYDNGSYKGFLPVIRKTEMYYIAAEALADSDPAKAVEYLNTVRENRNLGDYPLSEDLSGDEIRDEVYKEYRKELMGEGQLFYYYKRLNYSTIPGSAAAGNDNVYVLPMPDNEIEFGERKSGNASDSED